MYLAYSMGSDYWSGYNEDLEISAELTYNDVDGTCAQFKGYVSAYEFTSFLFRCFKAKDFTSDNDAGTSAYTMVRPMLKRAPVNPAAPALPPNIGR